MYSWQKAQWQALTARRNKGQLPHALLITGPEGIGKADFAVQFIKASLCDAPTRDGVACGTCDSCNWFAGETHPDFHRCAPAEEGKQIVIDQVRGLIEYLTLSPHRARRKFALVENAEQMNTHTANALLKSLEEPPSSSQLILVTSRPAMLLPTIKSRCQTVTFAMPDTGSARQWLKEQLGGKESEAGVYLSLAGGAPLVARRFAADDVLAVRESLLGDLESVVKKTMDPIAVAKKWLKLGVKPTLYWLLSWTQDMARLKAMPRPPQVNNPDLVARLSLLAERFDLAQLLLLRDGVLQAERYQRGNMNGSLLLEEWLLGWLDAAQSKMGSSR